MLPAIIRLVPPLPIVYTFCASWNGQKNSNFSRTQSVPPNSKVFLQVWFIDMWIGKRRS